MHWRRLNGQRIEGTLGEAVKQTLQREKKRGHEIKVCIGTDSQVKGARTELATVIVFLRKKRGGFMFIRNEQSVQPMSLRERMITEVSKSIEVAYALCDILAASKVPLEVHADINTDPHFRSNVALREAMGYITGMGFQFKMKPDAFASSSCADKFIRG